MTLKKAVYVASGMALAIAAAPSIAQNPFSAELLVGTAEQTIEVDESTSGDDLSTGIRGAFAFSANFAMEVAYQAYGEADDTYIDGFGDTINTQFKTTAINAGIKGMIPFANGFAIVGRVGVSLWDFELEYRDSAFPGEVWEPDDNGNDIYFGAGVEYNINESLFIGAEYSVLNADLSLEGLAADLEIENLSLSIGGRF